MFNLAFQRGNTQRELTSYQGVGSDIYIYIQYIYIYKVVENRNTQVKHKYLECVLKYSPWVNVLSYFPALLDVITITSLVQLTLFSGSQGRSQRLDPTAEERFTLKRIKESSKGIFQLQFLHPHLPAPRSKV